MLDSDLWRARRKALSRLPRLRRARRAARDAWLLAFWLGCGLLPAAAAARLGAGIGSLLGPLTTKSQKLRENLRLAFPAIDAVELRRLERAVWANAGAVLAEYPHLAGFAAPGGGAAGLEIAIPPHLEANFAGERLTVFVAGHLANWEVLAAAPRHWGLDLAVVYTPIGTGLADRWLRAYRERMGARLLPRDGSARELLRHLKAGRPVGIVADHRDDEGEPLPFFGHSKRTTLSPARLALRMDADLVAVRVERLGPARFRLSAVGPLRPPAEPCDEAAKARAMMSAFNRHLEAWITARPGEWLCSKRAFAKDLVRALPNQPLGAAPKPGRSQHA